MIAAGNRWELQSGAVTACKRVPFTRSVVEHLRIVFANFQDAFDSLNHFLKYIADKIPAYEAGKFASKILAVGSGRWTFTSKGLITCH